jgi:hypothetical protein
LKIHDAPEGLHQGIAHVGQKSDSTLDVIEFYPVGCGEELDIRRETRQGRLFIDGDEYFQVGSRALLLTSDEDHALVVVLVGRWRLTNVYCSEWWKGIERCL